MPTNSTSPIELAQQLARQFAARADEADRLGKLPVEDVQALKASGYLNLSIPLEYGGQGLSLRECLAAHLELAQGSGSTALVAGMQLHLFGHARETRPWPEETFARLCRAAVKGGLFNNVASEPQLGSPSRGGLPDTTAVPAPNGEGWIVNGHKTWTTGGKHLTHMIVTARLEDDPAWILVLQDMPGVEWVETWGDSLSLRASDSHDVYFNDVLVPADHLIQRGMTPVQAVPSAWFPMVMSTVYLGTAIAARNSVIQYALERVPTALGKPIATLPKIQRQIGEIDLALQAAQALLFEVAGAWTGEAENRRKVYPRIVAVKHLITETANEVTDKALRIAGGLSLTKSLPLERYFRDVRAGLMQPPSGDTALEIIGQHAIEQYQ
ncbi:MAG TPA: acyl-CoA dehydrogenase family protein, partial [Anaerolineae bacterium]|nr:acyl-CoA dehydrogenase family protein [Anaerolineae bacterium]